MDRTQNLTIHSIETMFKGSDPADSGSSSFYAPDPDKVQRLVMGNPLGHLKYEDLLEGEIRAIHEHSRVYQF